MKKFLCVLVVLIALVIAIFAVTGSIQNSIWTPTGGTYEVAYLGPFKPGTYEGAGIEGQYDVVHVKVTFSEAEITGLEVTYNKDTAMFTDRAFPVLTERVLAAQTYNVDVISSVTHSSSAFLSAVHTAIMQAGGKVSAQWTPKAAAPSSSAPAELPPPPKPTFAWPHTFEPDTYEGFGQGFHGEIVVEVTFDADRMTAIKVIEHEETPLFAARVWTDVAAAMIRANTYDVDIISGGTFSSIGLMEAVINAAEVASND
jgi:uncharacterized protein with FMN-binding domain